MHTMSTAPGEIMIDQKQQENVKYFNHLGTMITMMQGVHIKLKSGLP